MAITARNIYFLVSISSLSPPSGKQRNSCIWQNFEWNYIADLKLPCAICGLWIKNQVLQFETGKFYHCDDSVIVIYETIIIVIQIFMY